MNYGFTGTRAGMTDRQKFALAVIIGDGTSCGGEFHHGGCRGADLEAHKIVGCFARRIVHPGSAGQHYSWEECGTYDTLLPWSPYLSRNHNIVDATEALIAAPKSLVEERRSGTWATIRYARRVARPVIILDP